MGRSILAVAVVGVVASVAGAAGPSTRPATAATEPAATAVTLGEARARFESAENKARQQYRADLAGLLKRAMRDGDLRAANAANDAVKQLEQSPEGVGRKKAVSGTPVRTTVQARGDWVRVMSVKKGDVLDVTAGGEWCVDTSRREIRTCGPDGVMLGGQPVPGIQLWSILMARVGMKYYAVGRETRIEAEQDGVLEMRINDWKTDDNEGFVSVSVVRETGGR
jgi:hypothetical protein